MNRMNAGNLAICFGYGFHKNACQLSTTRLAYIYDAFQADTYGLEYGPGHCGRWLAGPSD